MPHPAELGVTHVIFDMDGLLINTEDLYTDAFQAVLDEFDIEYTFEMKAQIMARVFRGYL